MNSLISKAISTMRTPLMTRTMMSNVSRLPGGIMPPPISPLTPPRDLQLPTISSWKKSILDPKKTVDIVLVPHLHNLKINQPFICPEPESLKNTTMEAVSLKRYRIRIPGKPKNMLRIRSEKMNKHKLRKHWKKYRAYIMKIRMRRSVQKEKIFRAEMLGMIREAENFDAEKFVKNILDTIDRKPRQESFWERREKLMDLKRKYRSNVDIMRPKFEDPVP